MSRSESCTIKAGQDALKESRKRFISKGRVLSDIDVYFIFAALDFADNLFAMRGRALASLDACDTAVPYERREAIAQLRKILVEM